MNQQIIDILILAGGQARRLNGADKGLVTINEKPLIQHCVERLPNTSINLIISANRNQEKYVPYAQHVIGDTIKDFKGPLAGIYSALDYTQGEHLLVVPCDMPFLPKDLYSRLIKTIGSNDVCYVKHADQIEPLLLLVRKAHLANIKHYLDSGYRSVTGWLDKSCYSVTEYEYDSTQFLNINTQQDIAHIEKLLASQQLSDQKNLANTKNLLLPTIL